MSFQAQFFDQQFTSQDQFRPEQWDRRPEFMHHDDEPCSTLSIGDKPGI